MHKTASNNAVSTVPGRHDHPPQPAHNHLARRVNLLDRAALHLGVALIKWGRRPHAAESRERLASRAELYAARLQRERAAELSLYLNNPLR